METFPGGQKRAHFRAQRDAADALRAEHGPFVSRQEAGVLLPAPRLSPCAYDAGQTDRQLLLPESLESAFRIPFLSERVLRGGTKTSPDSILSARGKREHTCPLAGRPLDEGSRGVPAPAAAQRAVKAPSLLHGRTSLHVDPADAGQPFLSCGLKKQKPHSRQKKRR